MTTDQEQRVRAALRDLVETVPVVPPPPATLQARAEPRPARTGGRWLAPALAAAAVVVLLAAAVVLPGAFGPGTPSDPATTTDPPVLPERFDGASWRTASAADAPPGPVVAAFVSQSVLLLVGVDGRTYRGLDLGALFTLSHGRAHGPAHAVLSPDGTRLAGDGGYVIDLTDPDASTWYPIRSSDREDRWGGVFLAWSPDSSQLAYWVRSGVNLLDLATGTVRRLPIRRVDQLAFAPDGYTFAVTTHDEDAANLSAAVFHLAGDRLRELGHLPSGHQLAGENAWSPDGALLVTYGPGPTGEGFSFLDATGSGAEVPLPIRMTGEVTLLGWRSPRTMLVGQAADDNGTTRIVAVPVAGGEPQVVSWLSDNAEERVLNLQLATGLLASAEIRDAGRPEHGPLPLGPRIALSLVAGTLLLLLVLALRHWRRLRRRTGGP